MAIIVDRGKRNGNRRKEVRGGNRKQEGRYGVRGSRGGGGGK